MMSFGIGEFYAMACALAWGIAVIFMKKSGESLAPFALNLFKNSLALVLFVPTVLIVNGPAVPDLPAPALALMFLSGFLGIALGDTLYFHALNQIGASRMAVAQTMYSPFVIGLSMLFLGERLQTAQFLGVALVIAGIVLVSYLPGGNGADTRRLRVGALFGALAVFVMAIGIVMAKPLLEEYDFLWVVSLRIVGGVAGMLLIVAFKRNAGELLAAYRRVRHWPQIIAGTIIGTYISMMLWLAGYKYTKASIAAVLNEMAAVFILILAVIFLHERVGPRQVLGTAIAIGGVILVVSR